ncbi:MAG: POTRA domain-containing protein [Candidatus Eisenbacteria bacterium]
MRAWIVAAAALLSFSGLFASERVIESIGVSGSRALSRSEVEGVLSLGKGDPWSAGAESTAVDGLLAAFAAKGYLDAEVDVRVFDEGEGVRLSIDIREGQRISIERLDVRGVERFEKEAVEARFDVRPGRILDPARLERDVDRLLRAYARAGYPFARVLLAEIDREDGAGLGLSLHVVEGPFLVLGDLRVKGNEKTRESTVRRLTGLPFREPYDQEAVDACRVRLLRSGLFRSVSEPSARIDWKKKEAVVELEVEEARTNRIAGAVGYAPGSKGERGIVTGFADVEFRNILGTARSGGARWERISPETRRVRLFYREPWFLGSPFAVGGDLEQDIRDSTYTRVSGGLDAEVDLSRRVTASFSVGLEGMRPRREASPIPRSSRRTGGVGIHFEGRDVPLNPSRGLFLGVGSEYGERRIDEEQERGIKGELVRQATFDAGLGLYRRIGGRTVLAWESFGIGRFSNEPFVPPYDQFYLGGARTLRGYEEDRFRGARIAWTRLEYRYLLGAMSRLFLFTDAGYVFARKEEEGRIARSETAKLGYGFGIRVDSAIGLIGVDYGLGEGDRFGEGKIHVSAEGDF